MKKLFLASLVSMFMALSTQASENVIPAWACNLNFKGHAQGAQIIVGKFMIAGTGTLHCVSPFQEVKTIPVKIKFSTKAIAPRVALGKFDVYGEALHIGLLSNEPEDLLGTYYVAIGQGAVIAGAGAMTAIHADIPSISMHVSVQFVKGFGLNVGLNKMTLEEM